MMSLLPLRPSACARIVDIACRATAGAAPPALAVALLLAIPGLAHCDALGDARQLSHVGEPLRLSIPVLPDGGLPLSERCLALFGPRSSDGLPHILTARVAVERQGASTNVIVTTSTPVRDPVSRLVMRVGCDGSSRAYTLFLEPAGSTRMLRAVAQAGPRLPPASPAGNGEAMQPADAAPVTASPSVTTIPVAPAAPASDRAQAPASPNARAAGAATVIAPASSPRTGASPAPAPKTSAAAVPPAAAKIGAATPVSPATAPAARGASPAGTSGASVSASASAPIVTAVPGGVPLDPQSTGAPAAPRPSAAATAPALESSSSDGDTSAQPKVSALEHENEALKQQVARMSDELQRLQVKRPSAQAMPANGAGGIVGARWDIALPVAIALAGLLAVIIGGFLWHRRHAAPADAWSLSGPPSHRMASRTSLADQPVPFRPPGLRTGVDAGALGLDTARADTQAQAGREAPVLAPAPLRLQPSPDDLARELENELRVAERLHSALERAHPELVESLTRSWGTAAARNHLAALLAPGSQELARMSGEAVAELRLLLRVAEDLPLRHGFDASPVGFTPPAPAW